jgi:putative membrane protein
MKNQFLVLLSAVALVSLPAGGIAAEKKPTKAPDAAQKSGSPDEKFVKKAAAGGLAEVKLGELASQKAKRDDVKQFGAQMATDHSKANDELKAVASQKGIALSDQLDATHQAKYDKMSKLSGDEFDGAYVKDMLDDHKKDVAEFEKEANNGKDPDVKGFAGKTLPTLKTHLEHIEKISGKK